MRIAHVKNGRVVLTALAVSLALAGCVSNATRNYGKELSNTVTQIRSGDVAGALDVLEKNNPAEKGKDGEEARRDILYYFEKGTLFRLGNDIEQSRAAWLQADEIVREWEDTVKTDPSKVIGDIASVVVNDKLRRYDGQDYEKVFLNANLALDQVLLDDVAGARIELKKTVERETTIKDFRDKEYAKVTEQGRGEQAAPTFSLKDLAGRGYPADELEDKEVLALKNGYQNAFAHYLAGYFFEVKGEPSLSAPGYRNALDLAPDSKLVQKKIDNKTGKVKPYVKPGPGQADVLFVVESGFAPAWQSVQIDLPVPINEKLVVLTMAFPRVVAKSQTYVPSYLTVSGKTLPVETLVNVDALARRQLKDQLPSIIGRAVVRGILKGAAQYAAQEKAGKLGGLAVGALAVATERADTRAWRTLPARVSIARAILPVGQQRIEIKSEYGTYTGTINVDSKMSIVPIRLVNGYAYIGQKEAQGNFSAAQLPAEEDPAEVFKPDVAPIVLPATEDEGKAKAKENKPAGGLLPGKLPKKLF